MKIVFSAGERSGEEHGAKVLRELISKTKIESLSGMGGQLLSSLGMQLVVDIEKGATVMGIGEVLKTLGIHLRNLASMKEHISSSRPDILILVDYAEFNTLLAKYANKLGIKTYYIIPPQVWAWRKGRIKTLKKVLNGAALLFPFEENFWDMREARFLGHPLVTEITPVSDKLELRKKLGLPLKQKIIALFPGSRTQEIKKHLPLFENVVKRLKDVVPVVAETNALTSLPDGWLATKDSINLLRAADVGLIKSGTSNLQAALTELPFVMVYKTSKLSELVGRLMLSIDQYSIVNILKPGTIKEFVQDNTSPEIIYSELQNLLDSDNTKMKSDFKEIRRMLEGGGDFASNVADHILRITQ